ncbi:hypothetical protein [Actinomadura flavalba]|uniref:hypothetical protein n=1 Tax=Actinomadura flavalba TaxID=1120938 RepID=UPI0003AA3298|nr:hypothetical protein [Actinomadura flavalba]
MSDQGERGPRWTDSSDDGGREDSPAGPPPEGGHDVWGKVEAPAQRVEPKQPLLTAPHEPAERADDAAAEPVASEPEPDDETSGPDRKVAPVPEPRADEGRAAWEGELFDGEPGDRESDDTRYVAPTTGANHGRSGRPSSGNWQMPEWMADEDAADAKLGESASRTEFEEPAGRSRVLLYGGVGVLVVALAAAGGVYYLKNRDTPVPEDKATHRPAAVAEDEPQVELPPDKPLRTFAGVPSRAAGRVDDAHSGLSYPRFGKPWQVPTKQNKLGVAGWSGQQIVVTEKRGGQLWFGQLLTGTLHPTLGAAYKGPESVKPVAALAMRSFEQTQYAFPHKTTPLASQELTVQGRAGWLIASYLNYKRPPFKATGEVVLTAVVDTGKAAPAVVFASMPNTHRKHWPDLNRFVSQLRLAS